MLGASQVRVDQAAEATHQARVVRAQAGGTILTAGTLAEVLAGEDMATREGLPVLLAVARLRDVARVQARSASLMATAAATPLVRLLAGGSRVREAGDTTRGDSSGSERV